MTTKLDFAQTEFDFQKLQCSYLQIEKTTCALKLENAKLRTQLDEFKGLPQDVRTMDLNGIEESLFENDEVESYSFEGVQDFSIEPISSTDKASQSSTAVIYGGDVAVASSRLSKRSEENHIGTAIDECKVEFSVNE